MLFLWLSYIYLFIYSFSFFFSQEEDKTKSNNGPFRASSPTDIEKGQRETASPNGDKTPGESDNESEIDADAYNFTEDQKRAMMELMVQKQEDSDLLGELIKFKQNDISIIVF